MKKVTVKSLKREFVDKKSGITLEDPNPALTPEEVMDVYADRFPHLVNGRVEGPQVLSNKVKYTFITQVGTKG